MQEIRGTENQVVDVRISGNQETEDGRPKTDERGTD
jgi:hypothetical protein